MPIHIEPAFGPPSLGELVAEYLALGSIRRVADGRGASAEYIRGCLDLAGYRPANLQWKYAGGRACLNRRY